MLTDRRQTRRTRKQVPSVGNLLCEPEVRFQRFDLSMVLSVRVRDGHGGRGAG